MTPAEAIRRAAALYREIAAASADTAAHEAVAEWLESCAGDAEDAKPAGDGMWNLCWCDSPSGVESALKVARALGIEVTA